MQSTIIELIIAALIGSLPALIAFLRFRRMSGAELEELRARASSQKADAVDKLSETVGRLADRLNEMERESRVQTAAIGELNTRLERANKLIRVLLRGVVVLISQLTELGAMPEFVIPVYSDDDDLDDLISRWTPTPKEKDIA